MLILTLVSHFLKVRTIQVEKKISEIVNRLNKTKEEKVVNLRELREERDRLEREGNKKKLREQVCLFNYILGNHIPCRLNSFERARDWDCYNYLA